MTHASRIFSRLFEQPGNSLVGLSFLFAFTPAPRPLASCRRFPRVRTVCTLDSNGTRCFLFAFSLHTVPVRVWRNHQTRPLRGWKERLIQYHTAKAWGRGRVKWQRSKQICCDIQQGGVFELRLGVLIDWDLNVLVPGRLTFGVGLREVPGKPQPTFRLCLCPVQNIVTSINLVVGRLGPNSYFEIYLCHGPEQFLHSLLFLKRVPSYPFSLGETFGWLPTRKYHQNICFEHVCIGRQCVCVQALPWANTLK